jgi:proteic killer suppression protein
MEMRFKDKALERLYTDATFDGGYSSNIVRAFRKRMQQIRAAVNERDFRERGFKFEKLKGSRRHQHSMRLNDQWRLVIELRGSGSDKVVMVVCIEDYH